MKRALLGWMAGAVLVACGQTGGVPTAATASTSPKASPSPSASPSGPPAASIEVISILATNGDMTIHLLTISEGSITDRLLLAHQQVNMLDANRRVALITTSNSTELATLDLDTGGIRGLGVKAPGGIGPGVLSPDGAEAAIAVRAADLTNYEILVVDLNSGLSRILLQVPASSYNRAGLDPIGWSNTGILVSPGRWDGPRHALLNLDPQSAKLSPVTDAQVDALSPDGTVMAAAGHANLGDAPFEGQGAWPNRLTVGPIGGPAAVIAEQANRAFNVLDVANDGSVIYTADDAPFATRAPAADMGLDLETSGHSVHELGEARIGQWQAARFIGGGLAVAASQTVGGAAGTVEVDLISLCTSDSSCTATTKAVETLSGMYPAARLFVLSR
jgi:hypothetical protein